MTIDLKQLSILPIMIVVVMLAFSVRVVDVYTGVSRLGKEAFAAEEKKEDPPAESAAETAQTDATTPEANDENSADTVAAADTPAEEAPKKWRDATEEDFGYNSIKREHLQNLEERRQKLDEKEKNLLAQEAMIKAAQQEMSRKYFELKQLREKIEGLLDDQKAQEDAQIASLVKIYEGMKAKEAAAIFNSLDLEVLIEVFRNMSERKASPILAKMNPERAKTVTLMLAERKKLPSLPN